MNQISEREFARLCDGICEDGDAIYRHNPIGTREETLLWMLLSVLISYLSITEQETPCFTGVPTAETYRAAIAFILRDRKSSSFDENYYLSRLSIAK